MFMSHKQLNLSTTLAKMSFGVAHFNEKKFFILLYQRSTVSWHYSVS